MKLRLLKILQNPQTNSIVGGRHDYLMKSAKICQAGVLTENIDACVAGVVTDGKSSMMFHLAPEQQSVRALDDIFSQKMDEFCSKAKSDRLDALVCGGWSSSSKDIDTADKSIKLYNRVAELLEDWGARLSLFCGKQPHELDGLYAREGGVGIISDNWNKYGITADKLKKANPNEIARMFENKYETVEIHPEHVFIA